VFQHAADNQIAINTGKIQFAQPSVLFGGYILNNTGFQPNPNSYRPSVDFLPPPTSRR
jgi:hypothetical protein